MKIVCDLPAPLYRSIVDDPYDAGSSDWTPSSLADPPRIRALLKRHGDDVRVLASKRWWLFMGQLVHSVLERLTLPPGASKEVRLYADLNGYRIGGKYDLYVGAERFRCVDGEDSELDIPPYTIIDFKTLKSYALVFAAKSGGLKDEWKAQLNILAWLARKNDMRVDNIGIIPISLDWDPDKLLDEKDYPPKPSQVLDGNLWGDEEVENYILSRIAAHESFDASTPDHELPLCSPVERWERRAEWVVMKKGADRATKGKLDSEAEAIAYMEAKRLAPPLFSPVFRPGIQKRCRSFCDVARFCDYGRPIIDKLNGVPE